ncbi:hypothetical protein [Acidovorax sp. GBBC 3334]|uniref:hypothetical protein n=1 Tax=Acidovorax sp. GBBC 3334 TaxID=2940496 RepID=UPI003FA48E2F
MPAALLAIHHKLNSRWPYLILESCSKSFAQIPNLGAVPDQTGKKTRLPRRGSLPATPLANAVGVSPHVFFQLYRQRISGHERRVVRSPVTGLVAGLFPLAFTCANATSVMENFCATSPESGRLVK